MLLIWPRIEKNAIAENICQFFFYNQKSLSFHKFCHKRSIPALEQWLKVG